MQTFSTPVTLVLLVVLGLATATTSAARALRADDIRAQQAQIAEGIQARRGAYQGLSAQDAENLLSQQSVVLGLVEGKQTTAELDASQKEALFAALDSINAAVEKLNGERKVCKLETTLGSNKKTRVCRSATQMRDQHEATQNQINRGDLD